MSHAYLFLGPPQIGKTTFARAFAQAILCETAVGHPCGTCRACQLVARNNHPDFRLLQPLDKDGNPDRDKGELRTEQAADLIREVALRPVEGRLRVFLIQDVHAANPYFANKILKTLEEPPEHAVLLLTAQHRSAVLPTIVSRCQVLELRSLDEKTVAEALSTGWQASGSQAQLLARLANGKLGWAVGQLARPDALSQRQEHLETLWRLMDADRVERLAYANNLAAGRNSRQLFGLIEVWMTWWRDVLLAQSGGGDACSNIDHEDRIAAHARAIDSETVREYVKTLTRIEGYLRHTVNVRLALDVVLLRLPALASARD
ncbi:MAG: DNA polymerase III subunit delta' [Caldilineaceae bacterium]|nr:DNA polymerase III subunit delta' [Caldilineaceae bacterium]